MVLLGKVNFAAKAIPLGRMNSGPIQFCLPKRVNSLSLIAYVYRFVCSIGPPVHTGVVDGLGHIESYL